MSIFSAAIALSFISSAAASGKADEDFDEAKGANTANDEAEATKNSGLLVASCRRTRKPYGVAVDRKLQTAATDRGSSFEPHGVSSDNIISEMHACVSKATRAGAQLLQELRILSAQIHQPIKNGDDL